MVGEVASISDGLGEEPILPTDPRERIEGYLNEIHEEAMTASHERWEKARLAHLYYLGRQDQLYDSSSRKLTPFWDLDRPYRSRNLLRPLIDTQVGRMVKSLPSATVKPVTGDAAARGTAKLAAMYLEYQEFEHSLDKLHAKACLNGLLHGCAGYKICYSKERNTNVWEPLNLFGFLIDPNANELAAATWVTFLDHKDRWTAAKMAADLMATVETLDDGQQAPLLDGTPRRVWPLRFSEIGTTKYSPGVTGTERDGVEIHEVWHLPTPRVPKGLRCVVIGKKLVEAAGYQYFLPSKDDPEKKEPYLPVVLWSPGEGDHGVLGSTPVDDAVKQQRDLNERESHVHHLIKVSADLKLIGDKEVLDQWQTGKNQFIEADPSRAPRWAEPPTINPALLKERDEGSERIADVLGVNSLVSGNTDPKAGQSARSLAYVDELDSLKIALGHRSLQDMIEAGFELDLKEAQVFYTDEHIARLPGADGVIEQGFRGADLHGVTVRLEPRSGLERYSDQKAKVLAEGMATGLPIDPQAVLRAQETGHPEDPAAETAKKQALADLRAVLEGGQPTLQADPALAVEVLREAYGVVLEHSPEQAEQVRQLAALYAQRIQRQEPQPMPAEPGGA